MLCRGYQGTGPIKVAESRLALGGELRAPNVGDAVLDAMPRVWTAHLGPNPARVHPDHRSAIARKARREIAYEHNQCRFAASIFLSLSVRGV